MRHRRRLRENIMLSVLVYFAGQGAVFAVPTFLLKLDGAIVLAFALSSLLYHAAIAGFLLWRMEDLRLTSDGSPLDAINAACHLTLVRASAMPTIVFLLAASSLPGMAAVLIPLVALVFATDFVDGHVARKYGQTTVMGRYLDSSTDYVVLFGASIACTILGVIPTWYAALLFGRLFLFAAAMGLLSLRRRAVEAETTFLGKAAVFAAMTTFALQFARRFGLPYLGNETVVLVAEIATGAILLVSLADKVVYVVRKLRRDPTPPPP